MGFQRIAALITMALVVALTLPTFSAAAQTEHWVLTRGLTLRQGPAQADKALNKLAYGAKVTVLAPGPAGEAEGIKGHWVKVKAGTEEGYVFDQFICPVPPPCLQERGLSKALIKIGSPKENKTQDLITISQQYSHGVRVVDRKIRMGDGGYFEEQVIEVIGISVFQGFLLARAILATEGSKDYHLDRWTKVEERYGKPYINEDSAWQIIAVQAREGFVDIMFPERAD